MINQIKSVILISLLCCCVAQAGGEGSLDDPHPWGTFPKDFRIGYRHPTVMGALGTEISSVYLTGVIEAWNGNPKFETKLINTDMGCVKGDENFIYGNGINDTCSAYLTGGWDKSNDHNEAHFNVWSTSPEFAAELGHAVRHVNGHEADVFINHNYIWNRINGTDIYQCDLNNKTSYLIDETLLHEMGHAIGLGHTLNDPNSVMKPTNNQAKCVQSKARYIDRNTGIPKIDYDQIHTPLIGEIDFLKLKEIYQGLGKPITMGLDISSPENHQHLKFGQSYTFSAAASTTAAFSSTTESSATDKTSAKINATGGAGGAGSSTLSWEWSSDIDGSLGTGETITVNDLSAGWHSITVIASSDDDSEYGENAISVKVVSDGFYGEDSPVFFPSPCVRNVADPNKGCLLAFKGTIAYPVDGTCGLDTTATFTVENRDTGTALPATKFFGSDNCSATNRSDNHAWYFWLKDTDDQALVQGTFQGYHPSRCSFPSGLCFSSTYTALIPIKSASIQLNPTPVSCDLPRDATHCSVKISWSNGKYNYNAGLFYREDSQSPWVFAASVHSPSGSATTPEIVDESGVEFAIFQYAENPFGNPFYSLPSGQMTGTFSVHGRPIDDPLFLGETVFPFRTGTSSDKEPDAWNVLDNGMTLNLYGNTWKAINYNHTVTANTWLEFDYKSVGIDPPELAGVALLTSSSDVVYGRTSSTFQVDGTQTYGNQWFRRYFDTGWKTYRINVGHVMKNWSSSRRNVQHLGFLGDIDKAGKQIDISYRNPRLYEKTTLHLPKWGHSGNWYEADTTGQGFALEVNPINKMVMLQWFTYAEDGHDKGAKYNRWYSESGSYDPNSNSQDSVSMNIYQATGGRFNRTNTVTNIIVGTAVIRFFDCYTAHIEYDFYSGYNSGRKGYIPITRLTPNIDCPIDEYSGPHKSDFGYTGNWYKPSTSGQGFAFEVNPAAGMFFGEWFTYLPGWSSNLGNPNRQRWFTLSGSYTPGNPSTNTLTIYQHKGGALDDPNPITTAAVGTANVVFSSCTAARINYNFTGANEFAGLSGTIDLVRITANVSCE